MKHKEQLTAGTPINDRNYSFSHLPFIVDLKMAQVTQLTGEAYDTIQGKWCDEECQGAWDWDFVVDTTGSMPRADRLLVRFLFEFENDALLFKLRWF